MEQITLNFTASEQALNPPNSQYNFASNTVSYIKAVFDLGENWSGYDSVRAVWNTDFECISTVLDSDNTCIVPQEVLKRTGKVMVNLVGSIVENDELTDRLTTYPAVALTVNANAKICGTETAEITPSQFEQFAEAVKNDADRAEDARRDAEGYAADAEDAADRAEQSAAQAGYMFFYIDDDPTSPTYGCLIMDRTENIEVQFSLEYGYLFVEG